MNSTELDAQAPDRSDAQPVKRGDCGAIYDLIRAGHMVEARLEAALDTVGLSMPKYGVLMHLAEADTPLPLSELAGRLSCVRSNITQLIDRLEADGLVRRVDDPADRRAVRAELTDAGRERQQSAAPLFHRAEADCNRALSGFDRGALRHLFSTLK